MIFWGAVAFSSLLLAVPQAAKPALESSSQSFETTLPTIIDQSWRVILSTHSEAPAKMKPSFRLVDGPAAPPLLDGDVIVFSKNYLLSLQTLALVLGHDAYTMEFGSFPKDAKDRTLWNRTPLLPLWTASPAAVQQSLTRVDALLCPDKLDSCESIQGGAAVFMTIFVVAHELAHAYYGDPNGYRQQALEVRADREAQRVLQTVAAASGGAGSVGRAVNIAAAATPFIVLDFQVAFVSSKSAHDELAARRAALERLMLPQDKHIVESFTTLAPKGTLQTLHIKSDQSVDWISIDYVRLTPNDVIGRDLVVRRGTHAFMAAAGRSIAHGTTAVNDLAMVSLVFEPLTSSSTYPELMVLASQQKWGEVLLGTSTSEFAPRSGELALLHWKALRHLGLDNVSVNLLPADDPTARDILEIRQYAARAGDVANIFTRQKYHRLADAGEVLAQLVLAEAYMVGGVDIPRSVSSAVGFYRKAAEKGNNFARVALAKINEEGIEGAPIDLAETIKWMTLAADDGSSAAQFNLGVYYDHGIGVPVDPIRALYWYKLASDQGNKDAPCNIGILFANGTIRKDAAEAARWYRLGADRNDEFAQYNLGRLYQLGLGVPLDLKEAYIWLRIAAVKGHAPAVEPAAVVKSTLRPEALVDAERSVRAWLSAHQ